MTNIRMLEMKVLQQLWAYKHAHARGTVTILLPLLRTLLWA